MRRLILTILTLYLFVGCLTTYNNDPEPIQEKIEYKKNSAIKLNYHVKKFPILDFGSYNAIRAFFKKKFPHAETEEIDPKDLKKQGYYCEVNTEWSRISAGALIFGYISIATGTFLPAWSTQDGFDITYSLYKDGEKVKDFHYSVRRQIFLWIFTLPVIWVNLITENEEDAILNTTKLFSRDVKDFIK